MSGTFNAPLYGMTHWGDLFTARQKIALACFASEIAKVTDSSVKDALSLVVSKLSELACSICTWEPIAECPRHIFGRQAIPMAWDFAEGVLTSGSSGSFDVSLDNAAGGIAAIGTLPFSGSSQIADACEVPLPDDCAGAYFTDPPYYFAVPYADLSDFFFVWFETSFTGTSSHA